MMSRARGGETTRHCSHHYLVAIEETGLPGREVAPECRVARRVQPGAIDRREQRVAVLPKANLGEVPPNRRAAATPDGPATVMFEASVGIDTWQYRCLPPTRDSPSGDKHRAVPG